MTTLRQLCNGAARLLTIIGTGEVLTSDDMDITLQALTGFTDSNSNNRLMIYNITEHVFTLTGLESYTLGLGGDIDVGRPMKIEECYARLNPGTQQQLDIAMQPLTVSQYAGIAVKNTPSTFPFAFYDDNAYPLRTITLFPIPAAGTELVLWLREPLIDLTIQAVNYYTITTPGTLYTDGFYPQVTLGGGSGTGATADILIQGGAITEVILTSGGTGYNRNDVLNVSNIQVGGTGSGFTLTVNSVSGNLDTPLNFPPGYERFFRYNLAVELAAEFGKTIPDQVTAVAIQSKLELERLNAVPRYLRGDGGMSRSGRNRYFNWITGNFWQFGNN